MKSEDTPQVLAAVDDMFFWAKIESVAKAIGTRVVQASDAGQLWALLAESVPRLVLLDLNSRSYDPLDMLKRIKSDARLAGIRIVGFFSHVQVELGRDAAKAGCDQVLPRSALSRNLPEILRR